MAATTASKWVVSGQSIYSSSSTSTSTEAGQGPANAKVRRPIRPLQGLCLLLSSAGPKSRKHVTMPAVRCSSSSSSQASVSAPPAEEEEEKEKDQWVPVIPMTALPKGERRLVRQDGEDVLLFWFKNEVYAIENTSPAEGAYSEGLVNARLTQDGCIVCPSTGSTFDLKSGEIKEWFPNNPVLRLLTPPLRGLLTYPVKVDPDYIYISNPRRGRSTEEPDAEILFGGQVQAGRSAPNVEVDEVRMVVDEGEMGFGFTPYNELINGRSAMVGFTVLLIFELLTGKGFLKGIGFLDFLYRYLPNFPIIRY